MRGHVAPLIGPRVLITFAQKMTRVVSYSPVINQPTLATSLPYGPVNAASACHVSQDADVIMCHVSPSQW
jgi:hypothetical protein